MAEAQDLGSCQCGFESHRPHLVIVEDTVMSQDIDTPNPRRGSGCDRLRSRLVAQPVVDDDRQTVAAQTMDHGVFPVLIGLPGLFVAAEIGVTVPGTSLAT
jgi:hypothetical protein